MGATGPPTAIAIVNTLNSAMFLANLGPGYSQNPTKSEENLTYSNTLEALTKVPLRFGSQCKLNKGNRNEHSQRYSAPVFAMQKGWFKKQAGDAV